MDKEKERAKKEREIRPPSARFPSPPAVPFLLCKESGDLCYLSGDAKRVLSPLIGERPSSLLPYLSEEDRCFFTSAALEGTCRFLRLCLPATLPALSDTLLWKKICFFSAYSSYRKALVLLGLPFFTPPLDGKGRFARKKGAPIENPLADAIASFVSSRFLGRAAFRDPPSSLPWLDARVLALSFEHSTAGGMRSVGRCLRFLKRLFSFPELFPGGEAPLIDDVMGDPFALFLDRSDSVLVLLLALARFALDNADRERENIRFSFFFQSQRLFTELTFLPSPSLYGRRSGASPRGKEAEDVQEKIMALEDLFFPHGGFVGLPLLAQRHVLLLVLLQNLCRRFGWPLCGRLYDAPDEKGRKKLFLQLQIPVLHRKGTLLSVYSERKDEESDFLRFLSFLCPTRG